MGRNTAKSTQRDLGTVEGVVRAITDLPTLKLSLLDELTDKRIDCFLDARFSDQMQAYWRKRVRVTGMIRRDLRTGRPLTVTNITNVELAEPRIPNGFLDARGAFGWDEADAPSEAIMRQLRDSS